VTAVHGAEDDLDPALREVVASAVSARRTLMVQVNGFGFVCGLRLSLTTVTTPTPAPIPMMANWWLSPRVNAH
jgi:hypothetical protein